MHLSLAGESIPYRLERSPGRMGISFRDPEPVLTIRTPDGKLDPATEAFVREKSKWIVKHYRIRSRLYRERNEFLRRLEKGEILYMGKWYPLQYAEDSRRWVQVAEDRIILHIRPGDRKFDHMVILFEAFRALARHYITRRTEELAQETQSTYNRITVKHVVSKWGSCSSKRNLNFNWHLIFLPPHLIDYIIIHELMHLREMNHSPAYWAWVARYYPDYKAAKQEIHRHQWLIGILS